jgi:hypothetical protein
VRQEDRQAGLRRCGLRRPIGQLASTQRSNPGEGFIERPCQVGQLVEGGGLHAAGIEMAGDKSVALGSSQRVGEDIGRDALYCVEQVVVATATIG